MACPQSTALGTPASSRGGFSPTEKSWSGLRAAPTPAALQEHAPRPREDAGRGREGLWLQQRLPSPRPLLCKVPTQTEAEGSIQYNIFHYEIAISFPAFYLVHPELGTSFLRHARGLGSFLRRGTCPPRRSCQGQEAGPRSSRPAPHFPLHQGRLRLLASGACRGAYSSLRLPSADSSPSFTQPAVAAARKQQLKPSTSHIRVQTNRPEEGTWQGQCSTHTAVMQKGLGPASCLTPEPGRPGQRSQPPAHWGRSGLQPIECEVCKILVNLWNKESFPGGWVTDQEPSSLESVRSRMVREVEGRTILWFLYSC